MFGNSIARKPHKHAEVIKAWADGEIIECKQRGDGTWLVTEYPQWLEDAEYRIKQDEVKS